MKKFLVLIVVAVFFLNLGVSHGYSMTTEDVMKKMVDAQGGKKVLENVKSSVYSGSMKLIPFNMEGKLTLYWKNPNKRRSDVELMGMKISQAYNGEKAWMLNPQMGGVQEMPENIAKQFIRQSMGYDTLINPKKHGLTFALKAKEKIEDKEYIVLEQTYADGYKSVSYIDPETYLTYKTKGTSFDQTGTEVEMEVFPTEFKKVDGMMFPHRLTIFQKGQEFMHMTFEKVSLNVEVDDTLFDMPK